MVDARVHHDPIEPRGQLRVVAKAIERSIDLDEHVLRDVLRIVMVAGKLVGQPVDHPPMPLHERMESGTVAGRGAKYEVRISRRVQAAVHCQEYDANGVRTVDRGRGSG